MCAAKQLDCEFVTAPDGEEDSTVLATPSIQAQLDWVVNELLSLKKVNSFRLFVSERSFPWAGVLNEVNIA